MDKCPVTGLPCPHKKCIHVTEVVNYQATDSKNMCAACGLPYIAQEGGPGFDPMVYKVCEIFNAVIKNVGSKKVDVQPMPTDCPNCGHRLEDIVMTGKLGCGECYNYYKKELLPLIEKCQAGGLQHVGKKPKQLNPKSLQKLETALKTAIEKEEYEKANELKNEIKKLKGE